MALASGATQADAARKAGVCAKTAERRIADPEFRQLVDSIREGFVDECSGKLAVRIPDESDQSFRRKPISRFGVFDHPIGEAGRVAA